ncbi:hypothetical protein BDF19DRAFT_85843 [Syncephalis fuscata]|nr:hypothetical protein BDF19DRAFT_85843 [Syncephalis fuscata]
MASIDEWLHDTHWLRLVCVWTGWLGETLPETHIQYLLDRCLRSWSEKYEDMIICTLILSARQLMTLAKDTSSRIYRMIKSKGRSRIAVALAARYSSADTAFVRQLLQQTLNIPMPVDRLNFMAFGQMITSSSSSSSSSNENSIQSSAPLTINDIQQLKLMTRSLTKGDRLNSSDNIMVDILNSGLVQNPSYMKAIDDYIYMRLITHSNPPHASLLYLLRRYTNIRAKSTVPDYLPSLLVSIQQDTDIVTIDQQTNNEDTIVISLLLLLLIMESAEKRRQFDALYTGGQLLEQVDVTWWLTQVCRHRERFGLIVAPFVALLLVYAAELSTISRCLLDYDEATRRQADASVSPRRLMHLLLDQLQDHPYRDPQLLQVHLFYTPLLESTSSVTELDDRLKILYLMLLRSQRSMRMLHGLKTTPDSRGMDTFILLQETTVVRSCLDYCYRQKTSMDDYDPALNRVVYAFLNDFMTERLPVLKLLHWQGYPLELLDDMLNYMPVMQYCYSFLLEWLDRPDTTIKTSNNPNGRPSESWLFSRKVTRQLLAQIPPRSTRKTPIEAIQQRLQTDPSL